MADSYTTYYRHFESFGDLLRHVCDESTYAWTHQKIFRRGKNRGLPKSRKDSRVSHDNKERFRGTKTWNEAIELARKGWPYGREKMVKGLSALNATNVVNLAPAIQHDIAGNVVDFERALIGLPDCMIDQRIPDTSTRPTLRLYVNAGYVSHYSAFQVINYGCALLSHIDRLETDGYRVELNLISLARNNDCGNAVCVTVVAKHAGEQLSLDRMAFMLAHPSMLRRLIFAVRETVPEIDPGQPGQRSWIGMGRSSTPERGTHMPDVAVYLPGVMFFGSGSRALYSVETCSERLGPIIDRAIAESDVNQTGAYGEAIGAR